MIADHTDDGLETLLEYLKQARAFDFTGYKRASLARRIRKRMQGVGVSDYAEYVDYLEVHPEEFAALFNTILINVTTFFRDATAWEALMTSALPELLARKDPSAPIRVWSAGCASGEEAYTLAIVLAELLGADAYREQVKIYATDADDEALARARQAVYTGKELGELPEPLRDRYFERSESHFTFSKDFRRQVIFGRHDLIQDAPISRVDLLVCRNVLMYFNAETQAKILSRFHFALNDEGLLFLGRAETLLSHATTFAPVDLKRRISSKIPRANLSLRDRIVLNTQSGIDESPAHPTIRLRDVALDTAPTAQIVVDAQGAIALTNERARQLFGIGSDDIGRPLQDLKLSYRPVELRSLLEQVYLERRPMLVRAIESTSPAGEVRWYDLQLAPILDRAGALLGASVAYVDVTTTKRLQNDLEHASMELEAAYEELQSTNEELETTNEELQSTVEELETTNEELQSTNEELETMNEELQSTNEELTTMNDELRQRSDELNEVNGFLESVLGSMRGGVVVIDTDQEVLIWNERATDLWGLREDEVAGKHFLALDIGLPVDRLKAAIKACLSNGAESHEVTMDAVNRRGRPIQVRVTCSRLQGGTQQTRGVILVMEEIGTPVTA